MIDVDFWRNKKVLITGHTGFKGSWLALWLHSMGAKVTGYALQPPTDPSLFQLCHLNELVNSNIADIRNRESLAKTLHLNKPEVVFHMAAQPLVRESYLNPVDTYEINTLGTVYLLEAIRKCATVKAVVNVTTDKCYQNKEWAWGYRENEALCGYDPYSNSKSCSELITSAFRDSFFNAQDYVKHGVAIATARAGNVIGGGDWAKDRLIPDCVKALLNNEKIIIRNPAAIRPWQHVLEPLSGYLILAQRLYQEGMKYAEAWNFGPEDTDTKSVKWIVQKICSAWEKNPEARKAELEIAVEKQPHEANYLKLDISKAKLLLDWKPRWSLSIAISKVVEWTQAYKQKQDIRELTLYQIQNYLRTKVED